MRPFQIVIVSISNPVEILSNFSEKRWPLAFCKVRPALYLHPWNSCLYLPPLWIGLLWPGSRSIHNLTSLPVSAIFLLSNQEDQNRKQLSAQRPQWGIYCSLRWANSWGYSSLVRATVGDLALHIEPTVGARMAARNRQTVRATTLVEHWTVKT